VPTRAAIAREAIHRQRLSAGQRLADLEFYLNRLHDLMVATVSDAGSGEPGQTFLAEIAQRSFVVTLVMVLEGELKNYASALEKHHPAPAEVVLAGSVLDRFKQRLIRRYGFTLPVAQQTWRDLRGLYQLRTTLLHDDGRLASLSARKRALLVAFASQHGTPLITGDAVVLERKTCQVSLALVKRFFMAIYDEAEHLFP